MPYSSEKLSDSPNPLLVPVSTKGVADRSAKNGDTTRQTNSKTVPLPSSDSARSARRIVDRLTGFDVETIGVRYTPEKGGPTDEVVGFDDESVHDALARTDYLVLASPLTETTNHLIDDDAFETLPPDAYVVNVGRGPTIDTDALVDAIRSNSIAGAALDVTDPEPLPQDHILWQFENVTITPHHAGHSPKHWSRLADIVAENVERIEETGSYDDLRNQIL